MLPCLCLLVSGVWCNYDKIIGKKILSVLIFKKVGECSLSTERIGNKCPYIIFRTGSNCIIVDAHENGTVSIALLGRETVTSLTPSGKNK